MRLNAHEVHVPCLAETLGAVETIASFVVTSIDGVLRP